MIGEGRARCVDVELPAAQSVWCSVCSNQRSQEELSAVALSSRRPKWLARQRTLTMNFYGRCTMASTRNFMLEQHAELDQTEEHMNLLFGKIGEKSYALHYKQP